MLGSATFTLYRAELGVDLSSEALSQGQGIDLSHSQLSIALGTEVEQDAGDGLQMLCFDPAPSSRDPPVWIWRQVSPEFGPNDLPDEDHELVVGSVWFTVKKASVRIYETDEGVCVDIYPLGDEMRPSLSTWVLHSELGSMIPHHTGAFQVAVFVEAQTDPCATRAIRWFQGKKFGEPLSVKVLMETTGSRTGGLPRLRVHNAARMTLLLLRVIIVPSNEPICRLRL